MKSYKKSALIFVTIVILFEIFVAVVGQIDSREAWGDESHFHNTVIEFGNNFSFDLLKSYKQMSTPLPFMIYGLWGKMFGIDLFTLRILSITIAILTYLLFHRILWLSIKGKWFVLVGAVFMMAHPYNAGFSIFVFTDMLAIFFMLIALWGVIRNNLWAILIGLTASILCRQYMLFLIPPLSLYFFLKWHGGQSANSGKKLLATIGSALPYLLLVLYWGGTSPDNELRAMYLTDGLFFKFNVLYLYLMLIPVYLLPYFILNYKKIFNSKIILAISILISPIYWLAPISPAKYSVAIDVHTVGLFHKALKYLSLYDREVQLIFYFFFFLSLPFFIQLLIETYHYLKDRTYNFILILNLLILSFYLVMPFSYLGWEKYFMPLLPILILLFSWERKTG